MVADPPRPHHRAPRFLYRAEVRRFRPRPVLIAIARSAPALVKLHCRALATPVEVQKRSALEAVMGSEKRPFGIRNPVPSPQARKARSPFRGRRPGPFKPRSFCGAAGLLLLLILNFAEKIGTVEAL